MNRIFHRRHRVRRSAFSGRNFASVLPFVLMAVAYLIGCFFGARFGVRSEWSADALSILAEQDYSEGSSFLAALGSYGFYGIIFLILSTTYLGFLLIPAVFLLKGFYTGSILLLHLSAGGSKAYYQAGISFCLPGLFVFPALLLLGMTSARLSFQLLCRMRGAPVTDAAAENDKILAVSFVLLLAGAFIETYVVPFLIGRTAL